MDLKTRITKSRYRTQEMFAAACKINEAVISKYCRGVKRPSEKHKVIIEKLLSQRGA